VTKINELKSGKNIAAIREQFVKRDIRYVVMSFSRNDHLTLFILKTAGFRKDEEREWKKPRG
jgi:hypothetical protein